MAEVGQRNIFSIHPLIGREIFFHDMLFLHEQFYLEECCVHCWGGQKNSEGYHVLEYIQL